MRCPPCRAPGASQGTQCLMSYGSQKHVWGCVGERVCLLMRKIPSLLAWQTRAVFMCKPETHSNHKSGVRQGLSCILQSSVQEISSDKHRLLVGRPWKLPPGHGGRRGAGATSGKHETPGRSPRTDRNVLKRCSLAKLHQMHRGLWQAPPGAQR